MSLKKYENKYKYKYKNIHSCSLCSYTSYRKEYLTAHIRKYHYRGMGPVVYYKCPECLQCYKMKKHLISHLESHVGSPFDKPRICPFCNKSFNLNRRDAFNHIKNCQ
ncbi:unnamed protein product, partial [Meganyctiphanes norvegica]